MAAALRSEHLNYLILRYLQEFGHENAAIAFYKDWHRPAEYRDPELLPFAHAVNRNELITVIQDGLYLDELQARARKSERRFRWICLDEQDSVERSDIMMESGIGFRPPSSGRRKARNTAPQQSDDFPTPAAKRQRRSEGSEPQVNGNADAMDIDTASADADVDVDADDRDAQSPMRASDIEAADVTERYDSMDVATQTEVKACPRTSTMYWKVDKIGASILHSVWNPNEEAKNRNTLLAVGESLCRFYQIPETMEDAKQITHLDEISLPVDSVVTAAAWRPDGTGVSCAVDSVRELPDGSKIASQMLFEHSRIGGSISMKLGPQMLQPAGVIVNIRYNPNAEFLLVVSTNLKRGLVQVWRTSPTQDETPTIPRDPMAWRVFDSQVYDAVWTGIDTFVVCGDDGVSSLYQIEAVQSDGNTADSATADTAEPTHGLVSANSSLLSAEHSWDKVRYDQHHRLAAFASSGAKKLVITPRIGKTGVDADNDATVSLLESLTTLAFQPAKRLRQDNSGKYQGQGIPILLATAFADGACTIFQITTSEQKTVCNPLRTLNMAEGPALALSWSPDGEYLAVANSEVVQIWHASSLHPQDGTVQATTPALVTWWPNLQGRVPDQQNGFSNPEKPDSEPSINWSANGDSLAFAADKQISILRFTPSHQSSSDDHGINGRKPDQLPSS